MIENPEINNQIDIWLFQNEAIRAAFPVPSRSRVSAAEGELAGRSFAPELASPGSRAIRGGEELDWRPNALPRASVGPPPRPEAIPLAPARQAIPRWNALIALRRMLSILIGVVVFWVAGVFFFSDHSVEFAKAATAAYRTFADNTTRPVEIATSDRESLNRWFAPQILRALAISDLSGAGLILLGGRIVPGAFSPAHIFSTKIRSMNASPWRSRRATRRPRRMPKSARSARSFAHHGAGRATALRSSAASPARGSPNSCASFAKTSREISAPRMILM